MQTWPVNGIELAVLAEGKGPLVVLAHGFPDLALTWRLQVPALVAAGYRVVAPDMRGYGASSRPEPVEAYRSDVLGDDLVGLLDHEDVPRAHFVGHDWGASSVWPLGLTHPDRVLSLTGLSVPYAPPAPAPWWPACWRRCACSPTPSTRACSTTSGWPRRSTCSATGRASTPPTSTPT